MKKLRLEKSIYHSEKIRDAIRAYHGFADISESVEDGYCVLTFHSCKYDEERTVMEFENYLIELENT